MSISRDIVISKTYWIIGTSPCRAPKGCPPVLHQPDSDQLSACLKKKPKQMHSRSTSILAITENRGEGFDAVERAPHAKSIRLPCVTPTDHKNRYTLHIQGHKKYTQPPAHPVCAPLLCAQKPLSCHLCLSPALLPSRRARQSAQEGRGLGRRALYWINPSLKYSTGCNGL